MLDDSEHVSINKSIVEPANGLADGYSLAAFSCKLGWLLGRKR